MNYDVIVVGAGPAGSAAAITAARSGASVLLLEKGSFPRQRVCGEFVSAESLSLLTALLGPSQLPLLVNAVRIKRARIFVDDGELQTPINPAAASISRFDLDLALWESARSLGVVALDRTPVMETKTSQNGSRHFLASAPGVVFEGRSMIQCCGRWSNLNSDPAGIASAEKWIGVKAHFAEAQPSQSVDLYFFDGGYCGVQPVGPQAGDGQTPVNVCAMVRADRATSLPQVFELSAPLALRSRNWRVLGESVTTSPLVFRPPLPVRGHMLQAGDAAAFVDPFVGDGISLAMRSGAAAAESLSPFLRGNDSLTRAADAYRNTYERSFCPILRNSSRIRQLLACPKTIRRPLLRLMASLPALSRWMVQKTR
jgi:flavin-dependent dehydrogenase